MVSSERQEMEIQTSADPAVLWLRARQLCYLGGQALQSGEIIGLQTLKDDMPADLADSLKTDEASLVRMKENELVMLRATSAGRPRCRVGRHEGRSHRDGKQRFR